MKRCAFCRTVLTTLGLISLIFFIAPSSSHAANCSSPAGIEGAITYNSSATVLQYCNGANWQALGAFDATDPCAGSPSPGDVCADGSVYAGLSPDGNVPMYTTPADAGLYPWNNDNSSGFRTTNQTSTITGAANTTALISIDSDSGTGGTQPHQAAQACADLTDHGHADWYLPARSELDVLYDNLVDQDGDNTPGGPLGSTYGFDTSGLDPAGNYWSSTEHDQDDSRRQRFSGGGQFGYNKNNTISVRCVRKGYVAFSYGGACTNPTAPEGTIIYNIDRKVPQYCSGEWIALSEPQSNSDPCDPANSPSPGQACDDGSVYAGLSPDGNVAMYTTPADAGLITWNDGTSNWVDTAMSNTSYIPGEANTALLVGLNGSGSPAPYTAAEYCNGLSAHGQPDWYLPAKDELNVLHTNKAAIGGFNVSGSFPAGRYWSSSEYDFGNAWAQRFSDGLQFGYTKNVGMSVRCVRKGYVAGGGGSCSNPTAVEGTILYNDDYNVHQYCDGADWIRFDLARP